jgi:hypothetical protein
MAVLASERWTDDKYITESSKNAKAKFNTLDRKRCCDYVSTLQGGLDCTMTDKYAHGMYNLVVEFVFPDRFCIARISMYTLSENERREMDSEVQTMKFVAANTNIPVPQVYTYDTSAANPFDAAFMLMEGVLGWAPDWNESSEPLRQKIIQQMAAIKLELGKVRFDKIGCLRTDATGASVIDSFPAAGHKSAGPFHTALEYYTHYAESAWRDCFEQDYPDENARRKACFLPWLSRTICPFLPQRAFLQHGFPLSHPDFGPHNLLVDDDGNVKAVIDWSLTYTVPWETFCRFPVLLEVQWTRRQKYSEWVWERLMGHQECYIEALTRMEEEQDFQPKLSRFVRSEAVKAAEGIESYFCAPWFRYGWVNVLYEMVYGGLVDIEKLQEAVCSSFFGFMG